MAEFVCQVSQHRPYFHNIYLLLFWACPDRFDSHNQDGHEPGGFQNPTMSFTQVFPTINDLPWCTNPSQILQTTGRSICWNAFIIDDKPVQKIFQRASQHDLLHRTAGQCTSVPTHSTLQSALLLPFLFSSRFGDVQLNNPGVCLWVDGIIISSGLWHAAIGANYSSCKVPWRNITHAKGCVLPSLFFVVTSKYHRKSTKMRLCI